MNFLGQNLLWLLKSSIFELQNCNLHQKRWHFNLRILNYCLKTCEIVIALRKPKNAPHARTSQVSTKMGSHAHIATCYRTSQVATCDRTSQLMLWTHEPSRAELKRNSKLELINNMLLLLLCSFYSCCKHYSWKYDIWKV